MIRVCTYREEKKKSFQERQRISLTRVNLSVAAHSISIHDVLEAGGKFVGPYQGGGSVVGGDTIDK